MILYNGRIYESKMQDELILKLEEDLPKVLSSSDFPFDELLNACDTISKRALEGKYDEIAIPLLEFVHVPYEKYVDYLKMFSKEGLLNKIRIELNGLNVGYRKVDDKLAQIVSPLGVLFHISAGNVDFLPAYTVIEGLLVGNVNILKLPSGDNGLSIKILKEIIDLAPDLAKYIYVFDVPSTDFESIKKLAKLANGIVVWGGDGAIKSARSLAEPNQKIIEWGHKISFGYVLKDYAKEDLRALASDICKTNQLLCSSAQGIYFNSENVDDLNRFSHDFFEILKEENAKIGKAPLSMRGKNTLNIYNDKLENKDVVYLEGDGVSVSVCKDSELELSYLYRNVWIKPLPIKNIIPTLSKKHSYLQSVALIGNENKKEAIDALIKTGVTNISRGDMSGYRSGESHDGEYALMKYIKIVNVDSNI